MPDNHSIQAGLIDTPSPRNLQVSSPPLHQSPFTNSEREPPSELPVYTGPPTVPPPTQTRQREPKEFNYELTSWKGKPWAVLTVLGDPVLSKQLPSFMEGRNIVGSVKLSLESRDPIQAVSISVNGQIITGANSGETYTFLDQSLTLWSKSMGDPRSPATGLAQGKYSGKLQGDYLWPFSLMLPKEVALPVGPRDAVQIFRLPQTFVERHTRASVQYCLVVHITRNKLRTDSKLHATFGYIPNIQPGPPSLLRQLAYQENSDLLGPDADPEGWHTLEPVRIRGTIFNERSVDAKCILSLAKPLCYTRGSVIPCAMVIETFDLQALDLLSSPRAIVVRLQRCVKYHETVQTVDSFAWKDAIDLTESAAWWPSTEGATDIHSFKRHLNGEIHLKADLKPSSAIAHFRIEYSVVIFPFDAVAFESADTEPLFIQLVEIATTYATGPHSKKYHSSPEYESHVAPRKSAHQYRDRAQVAAFM